MDRPIKRWCHFTQASNHTFNCAMFNKMKAASKWKKKPLTDWWSNVTSLAKKWIHKNNLEWEISKFRTYYKATWPGSLHNKWWVIPTHHWQIYIYLLKPSIQCNSKYKNNNDRQICLKKCIGVFALSNTYLVSEYLQVFGLH